MTQQTAFNAAKKLAPGRVLIVNRAMCHYDLGDGCQLEEMKFLITLQPGLDASLCQSFSGNNWLDCLNQLQRACREARAADQAAR